MYLWVCGYLLIRNISKLIRILFLKNDFCQISDKKGGKKVLRFKRHCEARSNLWTFRKIASFLAMTVALAMTKSLAMTRKITY